VRHRVPSHFNWTLPTFLIPVAARSKALVYGCSFDVIAGSNPAGDGYLSLVIVSLSRKGLCVGLMPVQRIPTECVSMNVISYKSNPLQLP